MPIDSATLTCACADRRGLVAALSAFVAAHGGNILDMDQFTGDNRFYMRLAWDLDGFDLPRDAIPAAARGALASIIGNDQPEIAVHFREPRQRVAVFASRFTHCLADLLLRRDLGELAADFVLIVGNHPEGRRLADHYGVPFRLVDIDDTPDGAARAEAEQERLLADAGTDLLVLARYMRILSPGFVARRAGRIINIHHSFLPAFVGAKPYHQAKARGVKLIGATAHYVTADLDQGPIIGQGVVEVSHRDGVGDLVRKGRDIERQVLGRAVRLHLERRVLLDGSRTIVFE